MWLVVKVKLGEQKVRISRISQTAEIELKTSGRNVKRPRVIKCKIQDIQKQDIFWETTGLIRAKKIIDYNLKHHKNAVVKDMFIDKDETKKDHNTTYYDVYLRIIFEEPDKKIEQDKKEKVKV